MLEKLINGLQHQTLREKSGERQNQAAVLIAVTDHPSEPEIVLTRRAQHLNSHGGQVAFPGGKWDDTDNNLLYTALRESQEEIGLNPDCVDVKASLPPAMTRFGIKVTPYIGIVPQDALLTPNYDELDAIFKVPVSFFLDHNSRSRTDVFKGEQHFWAPVWFYQGFEIWGFTAGILAEFFNRTLEADIQEKNPAPVKIYC